MRHETRKLALAASGNKGTALDIKDLLNAMVIVAVPSPVDNFSLVIEAKCSGPGDMSNDVWFPISGAITQAASAAVPLDRISTSDLGGYSMPWTHVRVNVTTMGIVPAKMPLVIVAGRHARTN